MQSRRTFLRSALAGAAGIAAGSLISTKASAQVMSPDTLPTNKNNSGRFRPQTRLGLGGVALGNGFYPSTTDELLGAVNMAWDQGIRYFDTSPWYGLGLSERRLGAFLQDKPRNEYVVSTKIGRILKPDRSKGGETVGGIWNSPPPFGYHYDYSAEGTRRSIEDSLQRMGMSHIDVVFIHDLSPDNGDMGDKWTQYFETARNGAMKELTRMREEGLIKAWGLGINTIEPAMRAFDVADPDIILSATQYSLIKHEDDLHTLFPKAAEHGASIVVGAPLNAGFLAGRDRYDYSGTIPDGALDKRARITRIAHDHGTDLRTAALQFCNAPEVVSAVIPGARASHQVKANAKSMRAKIPAEFWDTLKREKLIAQDAPTPA